MANELKDYYNTGEDASQNIHGNNWRAQAFTTSSSYVIYSVKIKSFRVGTPGNGTMAIYATSGGLPTGSALCSLTYDADSWTTNSAGAWYENVFSSPITLNSSTQYALVISSTCADPEFVVWLADSSGVYSGGDMCYSSNAGSSWDTIVDYDFMFEIWGRTPESYELICQTGSFRLDGNDSALTKGYNLICQVGNFLLSGFNAILTKTSEWTNTDKHNSIAVNSSKNNSSAINSNKNNSTFINSPKS